MEVDSSPGFHLGKAVTLGFSSGVQVAVKIIDKTQLNSSSLQKVRHSPSALSEPLSRAQGCTDPFEPPLEALV